MADRVAYAARRRGDPVFGLRRDVAVFCLLLLAYVIYLPLGLDLINNPLVTGRPYGLPGAVFGLVRYGAAILVSLLILTTADGRGALLSTWPLWPIVTYSLASAGWAAPYAKEAFEEWRNLFAILVWVPAFTAWVGLPTLIRYSAIITSAISIASVIVAAIPPHLGVHHATDFAGYALAGNWRGIFINKNVSGEVSVTAIVFSLRSLRGETRGWRAFFWAGRLAALTALVFSKSANGLTGAVTAAACFALLSNRVTARPLILAGLGLVTGLLVFGLSFNSGTLLSLLGKDQTFTGRTAIWGLGWSMINDHPWFGHGFATESYLFGPIAQATLFEGAVDLHSGYMDMLFNLGFVGAALMAVTVMAILGRAYLRLLWAQGRRRESLAIYSALMVSACTMALGEVSPFRVLGDGAITFWFALVALTAERLSPQYGTAAGGRRPRDDLHRATARSA